MQICWENGEGLDSFSLRLLGFWLTARVNSPERPVDDASDPQKAEDTAKIHVHGSTRRNKSCMSKDGDCLNCLLETEDGAQPGEPGWNDW